ncbi:DUF1642 domain-containing protein [Streptococcus suis]|nr:DUF1642 domain-containing protein [Streptococcus suis]
MNKQEAIEEIYTASWDSPDYEGLVVNVETVYEIISQIHEPQKVVVPKFVAEWIEELKKSRSNLAWVWEVYPNNPKIKNWLESNTEKFMRAWLDGFEIEQEKLYTVEIPNPVLTDNSDSVTVLMKIDLGVALTDVVNYIGRKQEPVYQLTEAEIKQDFDWAWDAGFAKEVE